MRRILIILCCFYIQASLHAQPFADSLIKSLTNTPIEKRISIYVDVASKIQNKDYQNCVRICNEIISIGEKNKNIHALGEAYLLKGLTNYFAGEYDETLKYYLKSIEAFESINDHAGNAKVHNELGFFYRKQKQDSLSSASFIEAYRLASLANNKGIMGTALNNQGISAQDNGNHQLAISLFTKAQQLYQEIKDSIGVSYTLDYISVSIAANQNFKQAIALQKQALELRLKLKDSNAVALSYFNLAEFEKLQNDFTSAESYLFSCLKITEKINYKELTAACYKILSDIYYKERNPDKAYVYHVKYSTLNEELFNESKSKQINSLQTRYETTKRIQQIEFLQHENELKEINNRNQRIIWISILFIMIGISLGSYQYLKRKKQQEFDQAIIKEKDLRNKAMIEAEERERIRIARDLHDGVAQTMTAAKMQLEYFLSKIQNQDHENTSSLLQAFELMKEASAEVRSVSHSMIPNALLKSGLVAAVRDFVHRMGHAKLKINLIAHGLQERLDTNIETVVFRVLQELVNNIMKHAEATEITIQLIRDANELNLIVEDNGIGFDTTLINEKEGVGLKNMASRVSYLQGNIHFDSTPSKGTTVVIDIPLNYELSSAGK